VNAMGGYPEMGVFGAANQWLIAILVIPTIVGQVVFPHAARVTKESYATSMHMLRQATMLSTVVALPVALVGSVLSPWIMRGYGDSFEAAWPTLVVVLATAVVMALQTPAVHIIAASGRMWWLLMTYIPWAIVFVGGGILARDDGAMGLAGARLIAYVIHTVAIFFTARVALRRAAVAPGPLNSWAPVAAPGERPLG
jgi:O-antigen/teichoic acid export membrane protein